MEKHRIDYINTITNRLKQIAKIEERDIDTLRNIDSIMPQTVALQTKRSNVLQHQQQIATEKSDLLQKKEDVLSGRMDDEIKLQYTNDSRIFKQKNDATREKKRFNSEELQTKRKELYENLQTQSRDHFGEPTEKDIRYHYKRFRFIDETLPDFIKKNLADMPNNKGYIWKNCWFFGHREKEPYQPIILFEKQRGNILQIHEYSDRDYKMFEKQGKNPKKLVKHKRRIYCNNGPSRWSTVRA